MTITNLLVNLSKIMVNHPGPKRKYSSRSKLLHKLQNSSRFVGGEALSKELEISRVAVWKIIQQLKDQGYKIESEKKGYRLIQENQENLDLESIPFAGEIHHYSQVSSTMEASNQFKEKLLNGLLIIADQQSQGRDRSSNPWQSPNGGLYLSYRKKSNLPQYFGSLLCPIMTGALVGWLRERQIPASLKWPNEIYLDNKKLGGLLLGYQCMGDKITRYTLGIGLHVNDPLSNPDQEISLKEYQSEEQSLKELVQEISPLFHEILDPMERGTVPAIPKRNLMLQG
ncbi:MAG: biotin--[acetyl-CoA-carboxylase] ligase, partial [Spirochaetaceae bacterium]|nr:biotin--[acetyl-CoA-carboxylase] ligase [Spirochaetaceae bacterium]